MKRCLECEGSLEIAGFTPTRRLVVLRCECCGDCYFKRVPPLQNPKCPCREYLELGVNPHNAKPMWNCFDCFPQINRFGEKVCP